jgi:hypothetical protein
MNCGSVASARAISVRRRSPPESESPRVRRTWLFEPFEAVAPPQAQSFEHGEDVLLDRHAAEDGRLLRQVADAEARPQIHRQPRDVALAQPDAPAVGALQADDHVEGRRLPRPVRAEQAHHLARLDVQAHAVHHAPPPVRLDETARRQRDRRRQTRRARHVIGAHLALGGRCDLFGLQTHKKTGVGCRVSG